MLKQTREYSTEKLQWEQEHVPISVGIGSNVPGFCKSMCIIDFDLDSLLSKMLGYMKEIAEASKCLMLERYSHFCMQLDEQISQLHSQMRMTSVCPLAGEMVLPSESFGVNEENSDFEDDENACVQNQTLSREQSSNEESDSDSSSHKDFDNLEKFIKVEIKKMENVMQRLMQYISQIPVLAFNSAKYDINLVKSKLFQHLNIFNSWEKPFTVKKQNSYLVIATPEFRFLDISQYIAPGYSYAQLLKSYNATQKKRFLLL